MPENTVYVGRPSKWGNPYQNQSREFAVKDFEYWLYLAGTLVDKYGKMFGAGARYRGEVITELGGKNLAC